MYSFKLTMLCLAPTIDSFQRSDILTWWFGFKSSSTWRLFIVIFMCMNTLLIL